MGNGTMSRWILRSLMISVVFLICFHGAIHGADQEVEDFEFADNEIKLVKRAAPVEESDDEDFLADEPGSGTDGGEYEGSGETTNPPVVGYPTYYRVTVMILSVEFYPDLGDRNTEQFRLVAAQLQRELEQLFRSIPGQQLVNIIEFSSSDRGNLLATFDLGSSGFSDKNVLMQTMQDSLRRGYIGSYRAAADGFSFRPLDGEIQCPSYVGRRPERLPGNGDNLARLMVNNAFPCAGKLVGWEYYRSIAQGDAFAGVWRQRSDSEFLLVKRSLLPSAAVGAQQVAVYPPIDVQRGDFIGIFYPYDVRQNVIAQATSSDAVVSPNELYQTYKPVVYEQLLTDGQVLDLSSYQYSQDNSTYAIRALMDYSGGDGGTVVYSCMDGEFSCGDGYCIPAEQQCDGEVDCEFTGLDEKECPEPEPCLEGRRFRCANGVCINSDLRCDGNPNCDDGSDEIGCVPCTAEEFSCVENGECVPRLSVCDGIIDCARGSDEENCETIPPVACTDNQFTCSDGSCIDANLQCDSRSDCPNGEDEYRCATLTPAPCGEDKFTCNDGSCIDSSFLCDAYPDCEDYSDEDPDLCLETIPTVPPSCPDGHFRCDSGICLPANRQCDGINDCSDGADEANCESRLCSDNQFRCRDGTCIDAKQQCDSILDCPDRSDEENCLRTCGPNQFTCNNGRCIDIRRRCDDVVDCTSPDDTVEDRSDEETCPCKSNEFECSNGDCIPVQLTCDRKHDCEDGSDERDCSCAPDEHRCGSGRCIPQSRVCDRRPDCEDRSDELNCDRCRRNQFECGNGQCVDRRSRCDRVVECQDGSDEANCNCTSREFTCSNGQCIPEGARCDNRRDCFDGSDEVDCVRGCRNDQFTCGDGTCIDNTRKCDGRPDCRDRSDERDCPRRRRCPDDVFECASGHCLPMNRRCDGRDDCPNGSDEVDCPTCSSQEFTCDSGACVPLSRKCDRRPDCQDRSDERDCPCGDGEFTCVSDGRCLPPGYKCNGNADCRDGSDEQGCEQACDEQRQFTCNDGECISLSERCDGKYDCRDISDERGCPSPVTVQISPQQLRVRVGVEAMLVCLVTGSPAPRVRWSRRTGGAMPTRAVDANGRLTISNVQPGDSGDYICTATNPGGSYEAIGRLQVDYIGPATEAPPPDGPCQRDEATCSDGQCIPRDYLCDGEDDCSDGSDERSCNVALPCEPNEFRCNNGRCALKIWRCDGDDDCFDRSDETNCPSRKPGDPCNSHEFMCASGDQCVPLSYQCDTEIDCLDRSDEVGCVAPTISKPPPREIIVNINGTFSIICEAVGVPTPLITWRLNWGNIPTGDRVTVTSVDGRGVLTVREAVQADSGAYTCEAINNRGSIFAVPDALIIVRNTKTVCLPPRFNAEAAGSDECVRCFCFGHTQTCYSSKLKISQITLGNRVELVRRNTLEPTEEGFVQYIPSSGQFEVREFNNVLRTGSYYWSLPYQYLSKRLSSYGGELSYQVYYEVDRFDEPTSDPDVIISGNGITLYHRSRNEFRPRAASTVRVPLVETAWERTGDFVSSGSSISTYATREDLMMVLDNVTTILIRATYDNRQSLIRLGNVLLTTGVERETGLGRAIFVEECSCPTGYGGYSCEECAPGFYKVGGGRYGRECIACNCNGHSNDCDPVNGICRNCRDNTAGPYCNLCAPGFVGDPRGRDGCRPCPCPLTIPSNQFSRTCFLEVDGEVTCDNCPVGYEGRRCERCAPRYVGDPTVPGSRCTEKGGIEEYCDPRGSRSKFPDQFTNECECKSNAQGRLCDECKTSSFFLSADFRYGCISCFCMGVTQTCQSTTWNRAQLGLTFINSPSGVVITDMSQRQRVEDGFRVNSENRELTFRGFNRLERATYYWSLPQRFLGDKVTAYGGYLRFTLRFRAGQDSSPTPIDTPMVEIGGNDITLVYRAGREMQDNRPQSFQVRFIETDWTRLDGQDATREHLMMALADLDSILIRATYTDDTDEAAISGISMDIAEDRVTGGERADPVEQCACPRGYKGLSCEDCARGYKRTGGGLYLGLCEPCECNGHSGECDPETGVCRNCRHNTIGESCERCASGFYGDATRGTVNDCQKCPCPLTESPNQFSPDCMLDTDGRVTCLSCPTGHVGRQCERCAEGYQGNPMRPGDYCKVINVTCDCDPRGTLPNTLCDPDTQQCQCKSYSQGRRCSSCQEGFFNLATENEQGCLKCYCMGVTTQCSSSNYYREQVSPMLNADGSHNFALTNRRLSRRVTDGFTIDAEQNQVTFDSFQGIQTERDTLYFLLPPKFRGNKVSSYGGYLRFGISYTAALDLGNFINDIDVEIISEQGKRLYYLFRPSPQSGQSYEYQIRLTEDNFRNPMDSALPSREFFLTALANIRGIIVRAAYWTVMESVTLSDLTMDIAVPNPNGNRPAPEVEACVCPEGYTGLSCEECAQGFVRAAQSSGSALGLCIRCNCNGHASSCDPDTGECMDCRDNTEGERCERCIQGYYGDPTDGNPDACRECPCPLTIPSNQFSPTCFLDEDNQPTCDRCATGYTGRNCEQCAPGYTGNPSLPGGSCEQEGGPAPEIIVNPRSVTEPLGSTATFTCSPRGRGPFNVVWSRVDRRPLPRRARQGPGPDYRLTISQLEFGDAGRYVCTVTNIYGSKREVVDIAIERDPSPIRVRINEPTTIQGRLGATARFFCVAYQYSSLASVVLSWSKEGGVMPAKAIDQNGVLTIPNLDESDDGTYVCTGSDPSSIDTARAVIVLGTIPPSVRIEPRYLQVTEGDSVEFRCIGEGSPPPSVRWTKGPDESLPSYVYTDETGLFRIDSVVYADQAQYYCTATNDEGTASVRTIIYVTKQQRPEPSARIVIRQTNITAVVGTSERLYCTVEGGNGGVQVGWSREGGLPAGATQENGVLYLTNIQPSFRGTYICVGTGPSGVVGRATAVVNVIGDLFEVPTVQAVVNRVNISSGATETLRCVVTGNPRPTVTWSRVGQELSSNHRVNGDTLRILQASTEDRGIYVCLAENRVGRAQAVIYVEVARRDPPMVKLYPEAQQVVRSGGSAVIYCMVSGIPPPEITWTRANGRELTDRIKIDRRSPEDLALRFTDITSAEQGEYMCSATNAVGTNTATASIRVEGPPVIEITPGTRITSVVGDRVNIECVGIGTPTPNVFWRSGQRRRSDVLPEAFDTGPGSARLLFEGISKSDEGRYICVATGEGGRTEESVDIMVTDQQPTEQGVIIEGPREQTLAAGQSVELTCTASGVPNPRITWRRAGGLPLPPGHSVTNGVLLIPRIEPEYQGEYICTVSSRLIERDFSTSIMIIVRVTPQVTISPSRSQFRVGQRLTLRCTPSGRGPYNIEWTKVDGVLSPQAREVNGVLEIPQVTRADAGRYRCIARSVEGAVAEGVAIVEVSAPPEIVSISRLPEFLNVGATYELECRVVGQEPISIRWEKENGQLPVQHSIRNGVLTLYNVQPEDSGRYICTANNVMGTVRDYTYITIRDTMVPDQTGVRVVNVGDALELECLSRADGSPIGVPSVSWAKQGEELPSHVEMAGSGGSILLFRSVRVEDAGVYVCTVSNEVGSTTMTVRIVVEDRPTISGPEVSYATAALGSPVDLKCDVTGSPTPRIEWVKTDGDLPPDHEMLPDGTMRIPRVDEEDGGTYECRARNNRGVVVYPVYLLIGALVPYFEQNPMSYMQFAPLNDMYIDLDILVSFRPETTNGLMLYNGQYDSGSGDFMCFGLNSAVPEFRFDVGAGPAIIRGAQPLEMDKWHTVHLKRNRKTGTMMVNDQPMVEGDAPGQFTALDLVQPFYVGSVPNYGNLPRSVGFSTGYVGAISQIKVKGVDLNLGAEAVRIEGVYPDRYVCSERPCQNGALCLPANSQFGFKCRCQPGFVGERCEIEGQRCYEGACGRDGVCYNLPDSPSFMCACPMGYAGEGCRPVPAIVDPAFNKTSFISYPTLSGLFNLRLRLTFKPRSLEDGIILYNAQMQEGTMDFIAIIIKNRYLEFRFDMGNGPAVLRSREPLVVDRWTHVMVDRRRNEGMLVVDNGDPVNDQVEPNDQLFLSRLERGDISRVTSSGRSIGLNLQRPLFLGGVDPGETININVGVIDGFVGCVGEIVIGETQLNLIEDAVLTANVEDCGDRSLCDRRPCQNEARCVNLSPTEYSCQCPSQFTGRNCETQIDVCVTERPCLNGGTCSVADGGNYLCSCPIGWMGTTCETERAIGSNVEFFEGGYAELPRTSFVHRGPSRREYMSLEITTTERNGLIFWQGRKPDARTTKDFLALAVKNGTVEFSFELGSGVGRLLYPVVDVTDGQPHTIDVVRVGRDATLSVDNGEAITGSSPGGLKMLNVPSNIFFGGLPDYQTFTDGTFTQGFSGCVNNVQLQNGPVINFGETAIDGVNVRPCL